MSRAVTVYKTEMRRGWTAVAAILVTNVLPRKDAASAATVDPIIATPSQSRPNAALDISQINLRLLSH